MPLSKPIWRSNSGHGSVITMSLETIATLRSNCGKARAIQALRPSTTRSARTVPWAVRTCTGAPCSRPVMAVPS
ncbi:hypothetical protein D9M71_689830 [compost metagenome]